MRLAFLGTPDFAVRSLAELAAAGHEIAAVYAQPPAPRGPRPGRQALGRSRPSPKASACPSARRLRCAIPPRSPLSAAL